MIRAKIPRLRYAAEFDTPQMAGHTLLMASHIGNYLRELREDRDLTREEVIHRLHQRFGDDVISLSTLEKWERGTTRRMSAGDLADLVVLYEADFEDVFSRLVRPSDQEE